MARKKQEHKPADTSRPEPKYSYRMSATLLENVGQGINNYLVIAKRYRDPSYDAKHLAAELKTNYRYIAAAIRYRYGCNYATLVNRMRIEDAKLMLENPDCTLKLDEIAAASGFKNRQSFFTAFSKECGITPGVYRDRYHDKLKHLKDLSPEITLDFE